jgi:hypothetical protein
LEGGHLWVWDFFFFSDRRYVGYPHRSRSPRGGMKRSLEFEPGYMEGCPWSLAAVEVVRMTLKGFCPFWREG